MIWRSDVVVSVLFRLGKSTGKDEIQGFLHCGDKCAAFGRNDVGFLEWVGENRQRQVQPQIPAASLRDDKQKGQAAARVTATAKAMAAEWGSLGVDAVALLEFFAGAAGALVVAAYFFSGAAGVCAVRLG
jgi:hypothetical protein